MATDTEVCFTLVASMGMGGGYVPMIVETISFMNDPTIKIDEDGIAFSLRSRDYKDPQCVVITEGDVDSPEHSGIAKR